MQSYRDLLDQSNSELARIDPLVLNLLVARGLPTLADVDIEWHRRLADRLAAEVARKLARDEPEFYKTPGDWEHCIHLFRLGVLCEHLDVEVGITYKPSHRGLKKVRYTDPNDVFLTGVMGQREGTCGTMAELHLALGWRLGWPVTLTMAWWHYLLRFDNGTVVWNVETTDTGRGGFSCRGDAYVREAYHIDPDHVKSGSDLTTLTPRQVLGVFLGSRGRHLWDIMRIEEARADFIEALRLYPESRVYRHMLLQCEGLVGGGRFFHGGLLFTPYEAPPPPDPALAPTAVRCGAGVGGPDAGEEFRKALAFWTLPAQWAQGFRGDDANLYRYVENSPTNATDPSGLIGIKNVSIVSTGTFADVDNKFVAGKPLAEAWYATNKQFVEPAIKRKELLDPSDKKKEKLWDASTIADFKPFDVKTKKGFQRVIGARFAVLIELDEPKEAERVDKVSLTESAKLEYWLPGLNRWSLEGDPRSTYKDQVNIKPCVPEVLGNNAGSLSNISVGQQKGQKNRTLVVMDAPMYEFNEKGRPKKTIDGKITIKDKGGNTVTVSYTFTLGVKSDKPDDPPVFTISKPVKVK